MVQVFLAGKKNIALRVCFEWPRVDIEVARVGSRVDVRSHFLTKPLGETGKTVHSLRLIVSPLFVWARFVLRRGPTSLISRSRPQKSCIFGVETAVSLWEGGGRFDPPISTISGAEFLKY